jgi:hypothetical protein
MKTIEEKIKAKQYSKQGIASAVVKRADISARERNRLLELVASVYTEPAATDSNPESRAPLSTKASRKLDDQLLRISFQLLGLCLEHKLSRKEIYKRLEARLMAGMG